MGRSGGWFGGGGERLLNYGLRLMLKAFEAWGLAQRDQAGSLSTLPVSLDEALKCIAS